MANLPSILSPVGIPIIVGGTSGTGAIFASSRPSAPFPYDGLLAYFKLDGSAIDSTGSHNGITQSITYAPGFIGQSANFTAYDGTFTSTTGSSISMSAFYTGSSNSTAQFDFTLAFWYSPPDLTNTYYLWNWGNANAGIIFQPNHVIYQSGTTNRTSSFGLTASIWNHIVLQLDKTTGNILWYINGVPASASFVNTPSIQGKSCGIGFATSSATQGAFLSGSIDEFGVWSRQLTAPEVANLYNNGFGTTY